MAKPQTYPPLPQGFTEVPDASQPEQAKPPIPTGMTEISDIVGPKSPDQRDTVIPYDEYRREFQKRFNRGATFDDLNNYTIQVSGQPLPDNSLKPWLRMRDDPKNKGKKIVVEVAPPGTPPASAGERFVMGFFRGGQHVLEGGAQLALNAGGEVAKNAVGPGIASNVVDSVSRGAQSNLHEYSQNMDDVNVSGTAGRRGVVAGEVAGTAAIPMGEAGAVGKGVLALRAGEGAIPLARAGARLFGSGAATGAISGTEATPEAQDSKALLSGALTVLGVPLVEKLVAKVGVPLARKFYDRYSTGVGKQLFNADGTLNVAGNVFKARLMHASPGIDPALVDEALLHIRDTNPTRLPADKSVVPSAIAAKEKVPLTTGMVTQDAKKMQDFASTATGARGLKSSQDKALSIDSNIDNAIINNVKDVKGTDIGSTQAADLVSSSVGKAKIAAQNAKNALYEPVNKSSERIVKPTALLSVRDDVVGSIGESGFRTLRKVEPATAAYIDELSELGRKKVLPFGDIWSLSKRVSETARKPDSSGAIRELSKKLRGFIDNASPELFESGDRGVFDQLKKANAANRDYKVKFSPQPKMGLPDNAGKKVQAIASMFENPEAYDAGKVENMIYGQAKGIGNKETLSTVRRLIKAAPDTVNPLRAIAVNRVVDQMTDTVAKASGNAAINPAATVKALSNVVDQHSRLLKTLGATEADIRTLRNNAYLAALKIPAQGARGKGSSMTNRALADNFKGFLTKSLLRALPMAGLATEGGGMHYAAGAALASGVGAGLTALKSSKVTKAALSTKTPVNELNKADKIFLNTIGKLTARAGAAQSGKGNN